MKASNTYKIMNRGEVWFGSHTVEFDSNQDMFAWKRRSESHPFLKLQVLTQTYKEGQYE